MKRGILWLFLIAIFAAIPAWAGTVTFTAAEIAAVMQSYGAPLDNSQYQWGVWAVRAMPIVGGNGLYTITGASNSQGGWGTSAPSWYSWNSPYGSNIAWFWDTTGAPTYSANPLYMIMSQPANTFTSYSGNLVTAVNPASVFSFSFDLDSGATWNGNWQFVVDGSKYTLGTSGTPGVWVEDFFGGYGSGGGLANNMGAGYKVPEPSMIFLLGIAIGAVCFLSFRIR